MERDDFIKLRKDLAAILSRVTQLFDAIEELVRNSKAENDRQYRIQNSMKNAAWAAFVGALLYAGISILIWSQMAKQSRIASAALRQSVQSFRMDERAWLGIPPMAPMLLHPQSGEFPAMFAYRIYLRNDGKTEAANIELRFSPYVLASPANANQPGIETFVQNQLLTGKVPSAAGIPTFNPIPTDLAPGETTTAPALWHGQAPAGPQGGLVSYLIGRIDYSDVFGVKHWHTFCFVVGDAKGQLFNCKYGNKDDQNP